MYAATGGALFGGGTGAFAIAARYRPRRLVCQKMMAVRWPGEISLIYWPRVRTKTTAAVVDNRDRIGRCDLIGFFSRPGAGVGPSNVEIMTEPFARLL